MLSDYLYKTEEYRGYAINIYYDTDPQSPREWDNLGTIYSNSRNYDPDKHSIDEILNDERTGLSDEFKKNYIWLKIRGYEHSGLTISCEGGYPYNDPWDSGLFGIIAVSKANAIKEYGKKICTKEVREKALNCLRGEVKDLDMYYTGDVYGFQLEDPDGDVVDSCWGYFGSDYVKEVIEEAKSIADNLIAKAEKLHEERIAKAEKLHEERIAKVKANILILVGNTFVDGNDTYRVGTTPLFGMPMIEMATTNKGRVREDFYKEINLAALPEYVLENMVKVIG